MSLLSAKVIPSYVDGAAFEGKGKYDVQDPHDPSKVVHSVSSVTLEDVPTVIAAAEKAFPAWKATPVSERRAIVLKAAQLLKERIPEYAKIEYGETVSGEMWAGFEMSLAIGGLEEAAAAAIIALRGETLITEPHQQVSLERCPYGVVFSMSPWNAPTVLGQRATAQPILAGNTVILKTSEQSPRTQLLLAQIFADAGLPAGVLNVIHVAPKDAPAVTEAIIASSAVWKINFTGSTRVGSIIASTAGKHLKPVVLELGGKAPVIVRADADLKAAANGLAFGGWFHAGQVCMSTQTAIVHESVIDELTSILKSHVGTVKASGEAGSKEKLRGLFTPASAARSDEIVKDALDKGAKVAVGEFGVKGNVVQPIILSGVTKDMTIYATEMFSPVFSIIPYKTDAEAIKIANDNDYGLTSGIWTSDLTAARQIANEINAGAVHINGASIHDHGGVPHGGWKKSGFGRFNSFEGIREFTQTKVVTINPVHGQYPI